MSYNYPCGILEDSARIQDTDFQNNRTTESVFLYQTHSQHFRDFERCIPMTKTRTQPGQDRGFEDSSLILDTSSDERVGRVGRYSAPDIAKMLNVDSSTIRKCRFPWLLKAVDENRLRATNGRYTDLARQLFLDFHDRVVLDAICVPEEWVEDIKETYPPTGTQIASRTTTVAKTLHHLRLTPTD